ncbi:uncharacterized protein A4U43_C05F13080 [Asparagus officinalis]|uniref:HMG box domain-containing protein n=1 Tax=Asparagus officinalis TaxID=4686 RepID=A0A5P1ERA0_ASPOF|nr:high mobility group B protein 14 [Asparagus officinalis]XP_020267827.1 high mobility group B protein 14 [Asparagus officinalis]ONK68545.1 uncharacterized protein A4U43_C05F13080 [Asparagus officinalis]
MKTRSKSRESKASDNSSALAIISGNSNKQPKKPRPRKRPTAADDPKKPKKPPTAFFYYMEDFRKIYQAEHPEVKSMREIGKACGDKWKIMNFEEKVQYYDIATEKRAGYEKALAAYNKRKESGELTEESDDEYK